MLSKMIKQAKNLINLPYNKFNLDNFWEILDKNYNDIGCIFTKENQPIKLMSGKSESAGIVTLNVDTKSTNKIYLIGKGILFDSGGMNLKNSGLECMKNDKAGMIIALSIANYLKQNVVAYCPVATNFIHTSKIIPGDEIKIGKKIVKVTNTDAEGRLILAEAINTLNASKNDIIITIATLTGAVGRAIGDKATGVFTINDELFQKFTKASNKAKEYSWRLPLWDYLQKKYYNKKLITNANNKIKEGATEGAMFLKQFIPYPKNWIHLDIAYSAFNDKGASGVPIKTLINFIQTIKK